MMLYPNALPQYGYPTPYGYPTQPLAPQNWLGAPTPPLPAALSGFLPFAAATAAAPMAGAAAPAVLLPQGEPGAETTALTGFLRDAASALIPRLVDYLDRHAPKHHQLDTCVPLVQRAVDLFAARDYLQAFIQAYHCYRAIARVQERTPELPSL